MKKFIKKTVPFAMGLGIGSLVGFILRNSESTDYNAGYQPDVEIFDEKDYFTDEVVEKHQKEKAERKAKKDAEKESSIKAEGKSKKKVGRPRKAEKISGIADSKKGNGYRGRTRTSTK